MSWKILIIFVFMGFFRYINIMKQKIIIKLLILYLTYLTLSPYIITSIPLILYQIFEQQEVIFLLIISMPVGFSFYESNTLDGKNYRKVKKFKDMVIKSRKENIKDFKSVNFDTQQEGWKEGQKRERYKSHKKKREMINIFKM